MPTPSKTANGRPITYMKITDPSSPVNESYKGKVLVTAQHHVQGMTGAAMVLYIAESLLDAANLPYLQSKVFYLVPVVNPDSYILATPADAFTSPHYKNQAVTSCSTGAKGVNLDRNYNSGFVIQSDSCGKEYSGTQAFSELETSAINTLVGSIGGLDLAVDYDLTGQLYLLPKAAALSQNYELIPDYMTFVTQFAGSGEFQQSSASLSTYFSADAAAAGGTFIDYIATSTPALAFQVRLGQKDQAPVNLVSLLQSHLPAFLYLATHTKTYLSYFLTRLKLQTVQETACTTQCLHNWAISTIQLPFLLKNDAVGASAPIVFSLDLTFPTNSTYNFLITNVTVSSYAYANTSYLFTGGAALAYTNETVALPVLKLRASMPADRTRVLYVLTVNIERFKNPNETTYKDETLAFTYTASVNGISTSLIGLKDSSTWTYSLKASYVSSPNNTETPNPAPTVTVPSSAFGVGYEEPVMLGLGLLLLLLFVLVAVGMCGVVWMLNKPGAEAAEMPLAKQGSDSEAPFSPPPQV